MNRARGAAVVLILVGAAQLSATALPDRLMPLEPGEAKYRALLRQKLCLTPFDCGRIIVMPPFQKSEITVSIYSRRSAAGATEYYATSVEAADNLRDWSDAGRVPSRAKRLKVRRIDAPIPAKTAQLLGDVWTRMLAHTQSPAEPRALDLSYMDATMLEFCMGTQARARCGELDWVPTLPKKTHLLSDFAVTLPDYCAARADARPALAKRLDQQATALLNLLKS
jgi:hypothetical protein